MSKLVDLCFSSEVRMMLAVRNSNKRNHHSLRDKSLKMRDVALTTQEIMVSMDVEMSKMMMIRRVLTFAIMTSFPGLFPIS
jgi:hypothetical protein